MLNGLKGSSSTPAANKRPPTCRLDRQMIVIHLWTPIIYKTVFAHTHRERGAHTNWVSLRAVTIRGRCSHCVGYAFHAKQRVQKRTSRCLSASWNHSQSQVSLGFLREKESRKIAYTSHEIWVFFYIWFVFFGWNAVVDALFAVWNGRRGEMRERKCVPTVNNIYVYLSNRMYRNTALRTITWGRATCIARHYYADAWRTIEYIALLPHAIIAYNRNSIW